NGMRLIAEGCSDREITARAFHSKDTLTLPLKFVAGGPSPYANWGYAATVHKYQGSEAKAIVLAIPPGTVRFIRNEPWMFDRCAAYTAFSRAKEYLTVIGDLDELAKVIQCNRRSRITALQFLLNGHSTNG